MTRNMYGYPITIPHPSQPMELVQVPLTSQELAEAEFEQAAEADLHRRAEEESEHPNMYDYV